MYHENEVLKKCATGKKCIIILLSNLNSLFLKPFHKFAIFPLLAKYHIYHSLSGNMPFPIYREGIKGH